MVTIDIMISLIQYRISGISSQWILGGHLVNTDKDDGADVPERGWQYDDGRGGYKDDETLTVIGEKMKLLVLFKH